VTLKKLTSNPPFIKAFITVYNFKNNINDKLKCMTYNDGHIGYDIYKYLVEF